MRLTCSSPDEGGGGFVETLPSKAGAAVPVNVWFSKLQINNARFFRSVFF